MYSLKNRANAVFFHFFVVMGFLAGFNWLSCAFQRGQPVAPVMPKKPVMSRPLGPAGSCNLTGRVCSDRRLLRHPLARA